MAITQKWHTSRGTACDTERAATIRENAEILADDAHKLVADAFSTHPEVRFERFKHVVDFTQTEYPADSHVG